MLKISRPRFWLYEAGTFGIGYVASMATMRELLRPEALLWFLFFLIPANLLIYGVNDIFDYETDKLNPKKVEYEALVEPHERKTLFTVIAILVLLFIPIILKLSLLPAISLFLFFFFAIFYSAPPIRAKARPFFDSFFSAGHYVATGAFGYVLLSGKSFPWIAILAGVSWAISMHAYSAVPDIKADSAAGLKTIATKTGEKNTLYLCATLYTISGILFSGIIGPKAFLFTLIYLGIVYLSLQAKNDEDLWRLYKIFPIVNFLVPTIATIIFMAQTFADK